MSKDTNSIHFNIPPREERELDDHKFLATIDFYIDKLVELGREDIARQFKSLDQSEQTISLREGKDKNILSVPSGFKRFIKAVESRHELISPSHEFKYDERYDRSVEQKGTSITKSMRDRVFGKGNKNKESIFEGREPKELLEGAKEIQKIAKELEEKQKRLMDERKELVKEFEAGGGEATLVKLNSLNNELKDLVSEQTALSDITIELKEAVIELGVEEITLEYNNAENSLEHNTLANAKYDDVLTDIDALSKRREWTNVDSFDALNKEKGPLSADPEWNGPDKVLESQKPKIERVNPVEYDHDELSF
jgi:hypothetical protein